METPLSLAALLFLASYAIRVLGHGLPQAVRDTCLAVTAAAWAVFALDFGIRWRHSGKGLSFVRRHWLDAVIVVLPLLRPLQVVRTYDAVRRRHEEPRLSLYARVATYAGMSAMLLGFVGVTGRVPGRTRTAARLRSVPSGTPCGGPARRWRPSDTATWSR